MHLSSQQPGPKKNHPFYASLFWTRTCEIGLVRLAAVWRWSKNVSVSISRMGTALGHPSAELHCCCVYAKIPSGPHIITANNIKYTLFIVEMCTIARCRFHCFGFSLFFCSPLIFYCASTTIRVWPLSTVHFFTHPNFLALERWLSSTRKRSLASYQKCVIFGKLGVSGVTPNTNSIWFGFQNKIYGQI